MKLNLYLNKNKKLIIAVIYALILIFIIIFIYTLSCSNAEKFNIEAIDGNWKVEIKDKTYTDITLDNFVFESPKEGDVITLSTTLPELAIENPKLQILGYHNAVKIYLDEMLIYTYGQQLFAENKLIGSFHHKVNLPQDFTGKELKIVLTITESGTINNLNVAKISSGEDFVLYTLDKNKVTIMVLSFLIVLGTVLMMTTVCLIPYNKIFVNLFLIAFSAFILGIWISCNYRLINLFSSNYEFNTVLEYLCFYMLPIPLILYFYNLPDTENSKREALILKTLIAIDNTFFATACILQVTGIMHFPRLLYFSHIILVVNLAIIIYISIKRLRKKERSNKLIMLGSGIFAIFIGIDLMRFSLQIYLNVHSITKIYSYVPIGDACFFTCIITSYCMYVLKNANTANEQKMLEHMAYFDYLTKLCNRAKCEEIMNSLKGSNTFYTLIHFDLNNLKKINDTLGHARGDEYLKEVAAILDKCFSDYGTVGRMGGDEFLFIGINIDDKIVPKLLMKFGDAMENRDSEIFDMVFSAAYGCANSNEISERDPEKIFALADKRMYEMKRKMNSESRTQ